MRLFSSLLLVLLLTSMLNTAQAARDVKRELQNIHQQQKMIKKAQLALSEELGEVGTSLKKMDVELLKARKKYRNVRREINNVDKHLRQLSRKKTSIKKNMQTLYQQMIKEASAAYRHTGSQSIWVDLLSGSSITEIPHRQFLLKYTVQSQEKARKTWRKTMQKLAIIEAEQQATKNKLLALKSDRKEAERKLVKKISSKKKVAKQLRSSIKSKQAQNKRLARQARALTRLLSGLGDTLLSSDKKNTSTSIRAKKGKLSWPLKGRIIVGFGKRTSTGVKLKGVHLSPQRRSEAGKLVHALGKGQVRYADWFGGYGLMMIVDYGHGIMAVYAHNDALHKQLGDWVEQGETLAEAGSTGWIEDTRLYFEIRDRGKSVNPSRWCKKPFYL